MEDREDRIRQRAHALWQAEGEPEGRDRDHWAQAASEIPEEPDDLAFPTEDTPKSSPS